VTKFRVVALAERLQKDLREHQLDICVLAPMCVTSNIDYSNRNRPAELGGPDFGSLGQLSVSFD
jgi:hypothetical protein